MQRLAELVESVASLFPMHLRRGDREFPRCVTVWRNDAQLGRRRNPARRRIVISAGSARADVVFFKARIHQLQIDVLHVAGIDALIGCGDDCRRLLVESCLKREPQRQSEMDIALECDR